MCIVLRKEFSIFLGVFAQSDHSRKYADFLPTVEVIDQVYKINVLPSDDLQYPWLINKPGLSILPYLSTLIQTLWNWFHLQLGVEVLPFGKVVNISSIIVVELHRQRILEALLSDLLLLVSFPPAIGIAQPIKLSSG